MVWDATCVRMAEACANASPMVARLWKKYAARRKVNALSLGSSPKSSKNLTAWRWERMHRRRRNSPWMRPEVDVMAAGEEGQKSIGCRVCFTVFPHFGLGGVVEHHVGVRIAQLSVARQQSPENL